MLSFHETGKPCWRELGDLACDSSKSEVKHDDCYPEIHSRYSVGRSFRRLGPRRSIERWTRRIGPISERHRPIAAGSAGARHGPGTNSRGRRAPESHGPRKDPTANRGNL